MSKRAAVVSMTYEMIEQALHLPEGHHVMAVVPQKVESVTHRTVEFIVAGPNAPQITEGGAVPWLAVNELWEGKYGGR